MHGRTILLLYKNISHNLFSKGIEGNLISFLLRCGTGPYERGTQWDSKGIEASVACERDGGGKTKTECYINPWLLLIITHCVIFKIQLSSFSPSRPGYPNGGRCGPPFKRALLVIVSRIWLRHLLTPNNPTAARASAYIISYRPRVPINHVTSSAFYPSASCSGIYLIDGSL